MFVKQFFVICLLAATSVKAAYIALNVTTCDSQTIKFSNQAVGASDVVVFIKNLPTPCNFSNVPNMEIVDSSLYSIPTILFTTFPNLQYLYIKNSDIQEIRSNTFQLASKLSHFYFLNRDIQKINANAFSGANSLSLLYLQCYNSNTAIVDVNAFRGLPGLAFLRPTTSR
jgi:hypothetical protein